jgi:hypothetical protein
VLAIVVMVVGVGFLSLIIGAGSERFVAAEVDEIAVAEHAVEKDVERARGELLAEIRAISERPNGIEARMERIERSG